MHRSQLVTAAIALGIVSIAPSAFALPKIGTKPATFVVKDTNDGAHDLAALAGGGPTLVLYVDKDGSEQNKRLKARLQQLRATDPSVRSVKFVPIVDVSDYNHWPKRGFAKKALVNEAKEQGFALYADWDASGRRNLSAEDGRSNLVLLDKKGQVAWASAGQLSPSQEDALIAAVRAQATAK
jgi:hypothetical protein